VPSPSGNSASRSSLRNTVASHRFAVLLSVALLAAQLAAAPALSDPVIGGVPSSLHLKVPALYLILAPLFTLWDGISMLSIRRLEGFLLGLAALYLAWRIGRLVRLRSRIPRNHRVLRELGALVLGTGLLLAFLLAGALWHRPMLALDGLSPAERAVDFHSHTTASHDVEGTLMQGFDAEANQRWHARAGFDAVFITDHNTVAGLDTRNQEPGTRNQMDVPAICPGIEVSAWRAHIVLLGDTLPVDRSRYNKSLPTLLTLLRESESEYGALSLASIPEYRRNHWNRLDTLIAAGLDGFEVVNASPKANELTRRERDSVTALARTHNLFVVGVSDSHGWGATSMVWNLVQVPSGTSSSTVCGAVLDRLQQGFSAARIVERHRLRPDSWWPMWLTPVGVVWETWRSMGWALTLSWIVWVWLAAFLLRTRTLRFNVASAKSRGSSTPED
jgi:hypothetical protein